MYSWTLLNDQRNVGTLSKWHEVVMPVSLHCRILLMVSWRTGINWLYWLQFWFKQMPGKEWSLRLTMKLTNTEGTVNSFKQKKTVIQEMRTLMRTPNLIEGCSVAESSGRQTCNQVVAGLSFTLATTWICFTVESAPNPKIFFRLNKSLHLLEMHCPFLN